MSGEYETGPSECGSGRMEDRYFELWQHFEHHGDIDKGRMITVVTWFLGLGLAILGYVATEHLGFTSSICVVNGNRAGMFSAFGLVISVFAAGMVLFFARHATTSFEKAGECAKKLPQDLVQIIDSRKQRFDACGEFGQQRSKKSPISWIFKTKVGGLFPAYFAMSSSLAVLFVLPLWLSVGGVECPQ